MKFFFSLSYTWTTFIKFPLSNLDSNITVVSSEFRIATAAGLQPSLLPPIRDRINYLYYQYLFPKKKWRNLHNHMFQDYNYKQHDHYSHHNYEQMAYDQ